MIIETNRLILRTITKNDCKEIYEYSKEENVGRNAGWKPHESIEETKEIAKQIFIDKQSVWGIIWKESNKLIGTIGLIDDPKRENDKAKMLGYAISEHYWGKGIMTEAVEQIIKYGFKNMNLDLISAYCYPFNNRSRRVLEKFGFTYEGTLKRAEEIYNGNVYDNMCYVLLNKEKFR